ncbi:Dyp-type peroxidase [Leifsonia flava]|uniref:Dyp-type peroxidase n=1 Tax=Orlajensenia leifsoniae TaxID=2561933 RepID=A0A4Y9QZ19_9MICO|nr:Dyp-type peroxidase [Leifsonia flava]TFV96832.1 Dyp-type peroxidase [Leifsonia flava]
MTDASGDRVPIEAQSVLAPLTRSAIFLVVTIREGTAAADIARDAVTGVSDLVKSVGFRDLDARLSCVVGIGAAAWPLLTSQPMPAQLRPFTPIGGPVHTAVSTPGDLFFHIRADRFDLCFEFERLLLSALDGAVDVADEVTGFRYFDARDLLGFVDGTANPVGSELVGDVIVGDEDAPYRGGSYVTVQRYVHDMAAWRALSSEQQEAIMGRTKADNVELDDAPAGTQSAHKTLATITDPDGTEHGILRDNMPFGQPGAGEFGTYFTGYARSPQTIDRMLLRMFVGFPAGAYDRLLDFSTPLTGSTYFVPSLPVLEGLAVEAPDLT